MGRTILIWVALLTVLSVPLIAAGLSPLLAWREPVYIIAGFAGVLGLALMPLQPLAVAGRLPGLTVYGARRLHRWIGASLVTLVVIHVVALWITSPPDVIDALLLRSPTPFSLWGVIAMWAIFVAGLLAILRARLRLRWRTWRLCHGSLTAIAVAGTVAHALLIDGTMETYTKIALCALAVLVTAMAIMELRLWTRSAPR